jgi:hypothetical protein
MLGKHFNAMDPQTLEERREKQRVAVAYVLTEFRNLLRGDRFDCDRHGDQLRIDGDRIGLFDHGGLAVKQPSVEDKKALAEVMKQVRARGSFSEFPETLQSVIDSKRNNNQSGAEYLLHIQRGILAMSDFLKLLEPSDYVDIVKSLVVNNDIDLTFRRALGISWFTRLFFKIQPQRITYYSSQTQKCT